MPTFNVYREVRRQQRAHEWSRPEPTKVKSIKADDVRGGGRDLRAKLYGRMASS